MNAKLNSLLADQAIFYHKLQSYHWFVKGHAFFNAHAKLEEYYDMVRDQIDEVAELELMSGMKPISRIEEFKSQSKIKEGSGDYTGVQEVFEDVLEDFKYLLQNVREIKEKADEENSYLVSSKMDGMIEAYSKAVWMLGQSRL